MNNIFVTSDPHFNHKNVSFHCKRFPWLYPNPDFDPNKPEHIKFNNKWCVHLKAHNEDLINNWNKVVNKGDLVIIVGDFAWSDHNYYINALNGKKIMILGSHDKMNQDTLKNFSEVHEMGFKRSIDGKIIVFTHCAQRVWEKSYGGRSWHLYGHSHGRLPEFDNMFSFDIGVDVWGYAPVLWDVVVKKMKYKDDWIKVHGQYPVDGENRASGEYDKDPDQRVIDTRKKNKEIMKSMGYPIDERMWPDT